MKTKLATILLAALMAAGTAFGQAQAIVNCTGVGGTANAITCTVPFMSFYPNNWSVTLVPASSNTSGTTINVTGAGAVALGVLSIQDSGQALVANRIIAGRPIVLTCTSAACQLASTPGSINCDPTTGLCTIPGALTVTGGVVQATVTSPYTAITTLNPPFNLVAPAAITDTVAEYWSQIFIPTNMTLTGACLLNGATVTTDKHIVFLANAAGTIIANSALAGVADTGNASSYQCQAFTATIAVTGPGTYFIGTQPNGTTDTFYTYTAKGAPTNYGTGLTTCAVFGTLCNITPTVTFTTAQGPLMMVY